LLNESWSILGSEDVKTSSASKRQVTSVEGGGQQIDAGSLKDNPR
jgi:hypothetical protein